MFSRARTKPATIPGHDAPVRSSSSSPALTRYQKPIAMGANTPSKADPAMMGMTSPVEVPGVIVSCTALSATKMPVAISQGSKRKARISYRSRVKQTPSANRRAPEGSSSQPDRGADPADPSGSVQGGQSGAGVARGDEGGDPPCSKSSCPLQGCRPRPQQLQRNPVLETAGRQLATKPVTRLNAGPRESSHHQGRGRLFGREADLTGELCGPLSLQEARHSVRAFVQDDDHHLCDDEGDRGAPPHRPRLGSCGDADRDRPDRASSNGHRLESHDGDRPRSRRPTTPGLGRGTQLWFRSSASAAVSRISRSCRSGDGSSRAGAVAHLPGALRGTVGRAQPAGHQAAPHASRGQQRREDRDGRSGCDFQPDAGGAATASCPERVQQPGAANR